MPKQGSAFVDLTMDDQPPKKRKKLPGPLSAGSDSKAVLEESHAKAAGSSGDSRKPNRFPSVAINKPKGERAPLSTAKHAVPAGKDSQTAHTDSPRRETPDAKASPELVRRQTTMHFANAKRHRTDEKGDLPAKRRRTEAPENDSAIPSSARAPLSQRAMASRSDAVDLTGIPDEPKRAAVVIDITDDESRSPLRPVKKTLPVRAATRTASPPAHNRSMAAARLSERLSQSSPGTTEITKKVVPPGASLKDRLSRREDLAMPAKSSPQTPPHTPGDSNSDEANGQPSQPKQANSGDQSSDVQARGQSASNVPAAKALDDEPVVWPIRSIEQRDARHQQQQLNSGLETDSTEIASHTASIARDLSGAVRAQADQAERVDSEISHVQSTADMVNAMPGQKLGLAKRVELVLGRYLSELLEDDDYWTKALLTKSRLAAPKREHTRSSKAHSVFAALKPLQLATLTKKSSAFPVSAVFDFEDMLQQSSGKKTATKKVTMSVKATKFLTVDTMPQYAHSVHIKHNFLEHNATILRCQPYFHDEYDVQNTSNSIFNQYHDGITDRPTKLVRMLQAQKMEQYVESAMQELEITWSDVLSFLLQREPDVGDDPDAIRALNCRARSCEEDCSREHPLAQDFLVSTSATTSAKLAVAATLCESFLRLKRVSLWHIARRHLEHQPDDPEQQYDDALATLDNLTCVCCMRVDCPYHGEFENELEDEGVTEDAKDVSQLTADQKVTATDIINLQDVNNRVRMSFHPKDATNPQEPRLHRQCDQKDLDYWDDFHTKVDKTDVIRPCHHPGLSCEAAGSACPCKKQKVPCEKLCSCPPNCGRKFLGCTCKRFSKGSKTQKMICFKDDSCLCFQLGRECDPDLCGSCGVLDVLDPVHRHDGQSRGNCQNASIQRGVPKLTLLGDSQTHGFGLYAAEDIRPNEFVGEYKGAVISRQEADRRDAVYKEQGLSYLFDLNNDQELDSTYYGNKVRFINHDHGDKRNLYPHVLLVNSIHRVALYAKRHIRAGEELYFHYGPHFWREHQEKKQAQKAAKTQRATGAARGTRKARKSAPSPPPAPTEPEGDSDDDAQQQRLSAMERLHAYNVSDDVPDGMEVDERAGADDDDFDPDAVHATDDSEGSNEVDEDEAEDEDPESGPGRRRTRKATRNGRY